MTATAECVAQAVDSLVAAEMKKQQLPSLTLEISVNGRSIYSHAYGTANLATGLKADVATPYQIGSVTKQFTAAAIMQLAEAGKLTLDDPLEHYLPGYPFDSRLTLRMLLNQTSGLADYLSLGSPASVAQGVTEAQVLNAILSAPAHFSPGTAYEYSNSNYFILGVIIEQASGQTYFDYLSTHILGPAGLSHTTAAEPLEAAQPYSFHNPAPGASSSQPPPGIILDPSVFFAAGALWSNVQDLAAWDAKLMHGEIVSNASLQAMMTPPAGIPTHGQESVPSSYGMGWVATRLQNRSFVWHNGQTLAYTAFNGLFPDSGWSISILTNLDVEEDTPLLPLASAIVGALCTPAGNDAVTGC